jgi:hypothetical protein
MNNTRDYTLSQSQWWSHILNDFLTKHLDSCWPPDLRCGGWGGWHYQSVKSEGAHACWYHFSISKRIEEQEACYPTKESKKHHRHKGSNILGGSKRSRECYLLRKPQILPKVSRQHSARKSRVVFESQAVAAEVLLLDLWKWGADYHW